MTGRTILYNSAVLNLADVNQADLAQVCLPETLPHLEERLFYVPNE